MSRRWWMFLLTAVLSTMPGCAVDSTREVAEYRRVIDLPDRLEDRDPAHPLTLPEALWLANRLNERLDIEGENYLQALIERRRAAAAFQPTVDLSPVYAMRDRTNGGGSDNNGNSSNNSNTFDVPLGVEISRARWPMANWGCVPMPRMPGSC